MKNKLFVQAKNLLSLVRAKHLLPVFGILALASSCKKNEDDQALLTSGKWYYDYVDNLHNVGTHNCFNEADYIEFRTDGTLSITSLGTGNYTLSDDSKNMTITLNANIKDQYSQWKGTINLIKENYLRMTVIAVRDINQDYGYEITLYKKRNNPNCQPPK